MQPETTLLRSLQEDLPNLRLGRIDVLPHSTMYRYSVSRSFVVSMAGSHRVTFENLGLYKYLGHFCSTNTLVDQPMKHCIDKCYGSTDGFGAAEILTPVLTSIIIETFRHKPRSTDPVGV